MPAGRDIRVADFVIRGGMLYVGRGLVDAAGHGVEPALIDPTLPVDGARPDWTGETMDYWPSYSDMSPRARAAYLAWLAGGRSNPRAYIGYVFVYFYGLERRLLAEVPGTPDAAAGFHLLTGEVRRLLGIYRGNRSFAQYASSLLDCVAILDPTARWNGPPPEIPEWSHELPPELRLGLGQLVAAGRPLPADWALAWYTHHPETRVRTPAQRCPDEFRELFTARYRERFGDGLLVKPNKTRLSSRYFPASGGFDGEVRLENPALPDVGKLTGPVTKLQDLVEAVTDDLDPYSRQLGRHPGDTGSPAAVALLPQGVSFRADERTERFWSWAARGIDGNDRSVVAAQELIEHWPTGTGKLATADAVAVAQLLEKRGLGIEPDVRFGGAVLRPASSVVLFRRGEQPVSAPGPHYGTALAIINLGTLVAAADGTVTEPERAALRDLAFSGLDLSADERIRLDAHAALVLTKPPTASALRRRLSVLPDERRADVGRLLTTIAAADGRVTPDEVRTMEKLFRELGLDPNDVYSTLHATAVAAEPDELASVRLPGAAPAGRAIPAQPRRTATLRLDSARLARTRAESAAVAAELAEIFADESEPVPTPPPVAALETIAGLDPDFSNDAYAVL
ncbi:tellurite resistance TerB family protein [Amycolatopsis thermoflava]|uniref:tellurite resistance TerB family protein n=1 Tax=Amycolatopsis thermoflava TaxID=84480 RepID=UPI0037F7E7D6